MAKIDNLVTTEELSNQQIEHQKSYCKKIAGRYEHYTEDVLKFVFSPFFQPEVWEDASRVYPKLIQDFLPLDQKEVPVLFVGARSQNKFTRKSEAIGFLLTDHMIYVKEASVFTDYLSKIYPYSVSKIEAQKVLDKAIASFDWEYLEMILSKETKKELLQLLSEAIVDILTVKETLGIDHIEAMKASDLLGRINELGLLSSSFVKIGDDDKHKKHFQKVTKKFMISPDDNIQFAITDSTLVGPYGLVITDNSVYSKDLMEKPQCTSRYKLEKNYPIKIIEDSILLGTNIVHILPNSLSDSEKESLRTLIMEFLNGELTP